MATETHRRTFDQRDGDRGTTILILDDEEFVRANLVRLCKSIEVDSGLNVLTASTLSEAQDILAATAVNVLLIDKNLRHADGQDDGNDDGISAIPEFLQLRPQLQVVVISGSRDSQDIVKAMRLGAFSYVTKGLDDELLPSQITKAIHFSKLAMDNCRYEKKDRPSEQADLVGSSPSIRRLRALIPQLAETDSPVLLLGETGTGKTTLAKLIHRYRKEYLKQDRRPFFYVNIPSIAPTLVERELFGAEPGAYTGALKTTHQGFFELANTGTLFLDEIADISLDVQTKLLEVLQDGTFYRVGGTKKINSSFKLICATNKNLYELVQQKRFREDLYWRIAALPIELPPLNTRSEDIPELVQSLLPKISKQTHVLLSYDDLPKDFIAYLTTNPPEGNIRGLEHRLTQLLMLAPKDKFGVRLLTAWKRIPELAGKKQKTSSAALSMNDVVSSGVDITDKDFPVFREFVRSLEDKLILDARSRLRSIREMERVLKLPRSTISTRLREIKRESAARAKPTENLL